MVEGRTRPTGRGRVVKGTLVSITLLAAMACTPKGPPPPPPPPPPPFFPGDIDLMTDAEAVAALEYVADDVAEGFEDPRATAGIPDEYRNEVRKILQNFTTDTGRLKLVEEIRELSDIASHGLPFRPERFDVGDLGLSTGTFTESFEDPPATGVRTPPPTGSGTTVDGEPAGVSADLGPTTDTTCGAPQSEGSVAAPDGVRPGQLLTPQHDVFLQTSPGIGGQPGPLSVAGVDPISGGGAGVELRNDASGQQMRVQIALDNPKLGGPGALFPLINIRPIGGTADDEYRATVSDARVHCYLDDDLGRRGYFDGWITIPRSEPGFQVIVEVVENEHYYRCVDFNPTCDLLLSVRGPQLWAGADRATIHAGAAPVTTAAVLPKSVGAFATGVGDPVSPTPNALTNTNGEMGDDLEAALTKFLDGQIRSKVDSALSGDLVDKTLIVIQAELSKPIENSIDLRWTTPQDPVGLLCPLLPSACTAGGTDEPSGATGALRADAHVRADIRLNAMLLGLECDNLGGNVQVDLRANVWADSDGDGTGITPRLEYDVNSDTTLDMPLIAWANPICVAAWGVSWLGIGDHFVESGVEDGLNGAFKDSIATACLVDPGIFNPDGSLVNPSAGLPDRCIAKGSIKKLLEGFDLSAYLPTIELGGATIKPLVTDIDNSWCTAPGAPPGCSPDQDLFGRDGVGVVADTTLIASLGQALGGALGGRFPNVFSPTVVGSASELTTSHQDASGSAAALGVLVDPRLVNLALRHLSQGTSTTRDSNGVFDLEDVELSTSGVTLSVHPEVAPQVLGAARLDKQPLVAVVAPDIRASLNLGPESGPPVEFSMALSLNAGVERDGRNGLTKPVLDTMQIDVQVTDNCKVDYVNAYALSYAICGRGQAGAGARNSDGSPISLLDVVHFFVNNVGLPMVDNTIAGIELPSLDGIVSGIHLSLDNVRFAQRGGFLGLYSDLKPTPRVSIAPTLDPQGDFVRFFPSQLFGVDVTKPTTWSWKITDGATGLPVSTTVIPDTGNAGVRAPLDAFVEVPSFYVVPNTDPPQIIPTNFGPEKTAVAELTLTQANLRITARAEFKWYPPTTPPIDPCSTTPTTVLRAALRPLPTTPPPGC
jgi:hypothetical protein